MIRVIFREIEWRAQDYEWSEGGHIVSILNFDLKENGALNTGLSARILQPEEAPCGSALLEISRPTNYDGPFDFEAFREAATAYYREACREGMSGIWSRVVEVELHPSLGH